MIDDYASTEEDLEKEYDSIPEQESSLRIFFEYSAILLGTHGIIYVIACGYV